MRRASGVLAVLLALAAVVAQPPPGAQEAGRSAAPPSDGPPPGAKEAGGAPPPGAKEAGGGPPPGAKLATTKSPTRAPTTPQGCVLSPWTEWSKCTQTCGGGTMTRTRKIIAKPPPGVKCPGSMLYDAKECGMVDCPVDCELGDWTAYTACSVSCGNGYQTRTRPIAVLSKGAGKLCPAEFDRREIDKCEVGVCPLSCKVGDWDDWSECTATCGPGVHRLRKRKVLRPAEPDGDLCPSTLEAEMCPKVDCPIDCQVGDWELWSECSVSCDWKKGSRTRTRGIKVALHASGHSCPATEESAACGQYLPDCPKVHCTVGDWLEWGPCSKSCGPGFTTRVRKVWKKDPEHSKPCPHIEQSEACARHSIPGYDPVKALRCPVDCEMGDWTEWSVCDKSCDGGERARFREAVQTPIFGGKACGVTEVTHRCNTQHCPVDCPAGPWSDWSMCSVTCGGGENFRRRKVLGEPRFGGQPCTHITKGIQTCNLGECPASEDDCMMSTFSAFGSCSRSCGGGRRQSDRVFIKGDQAICVRLGIKLVQNLECNVQPCPVDCTVGDWGEWHANPHAYRGKNLHMMRERKMVAPASFAGASCPSLIERRGHKVQCLHQTVKGDWSGCSKKCGIGYKYRYVERLFCSMNIAAKLHTTHREGKHCNIQPCRDAAQAAQFNMIHIPKLKISTEDGILQVLDAPPTIVSVDVNQRRPTSAPTAYPTTAFPTASPIPTHHCELHTHHCWKNKVASAKCVKKPGSVDYICECPQGYIQTRMHLSHMISEDWHHLSHQCKLAKTLYPTASPTKLPTTSPTLYRLHPCDDNSHYCWKGDASKATCRKIGPDYDCECPAGMKQTRVHIAHYISKKADVLRHLCGDTPKPTQAPTKKSKPFACEDDKLKCSYPCATGKHCCSSYLNQIGMCKTCMSNACPEEMAAIAAEESMM